VDGVGVVMEYGLGGFFGELALRESTPRAATVRARVSSLAYWTSCQPLDVQFNLLYQEPRALGLI
jgi:hypothetical protein